MSRIFKRGKIWYIDFEYQGKRYRKSLQTRSKQIAELALKDTDVKIARERFDLATPTKINFEDFARKFLEWYKVQNSKKAYIDYRSLFMATLIPYFEGIKLTDMQSLMIEEYKIYRSEHVASSSVNKDLVALRHLFNKAILWGFMTQNPVKNVKKLKVKQKAIRFLTVEEIDDLLEVSPPYAKPIFITAIHAGLRKSELFRLEWDDINFERGILIVKNKDDAHTKNYKNREIPMTDHLYSVLKELKNKFNSGSGNVFLKPDGTPHRGEIRKTISRCILRAHLKPFTFHDLRHTFASQLVMDGVDLPTVKELMGHSNISTTMLYAHLAPDHLNGAIRRLGRRLNNDQTKRE